MILTAMSCPHCKSTVKEVFNSEDFKVDSFAICSNCFRLVVLENNKLRRMHLKEAFSAYFKLLKQCEINASEILVYKINIVRKALMSMTNDVAQLN